MLTMSQTLVGRVAPRAPNSALVLQSGAHGVTRPTTLRSFRSTLRNLNQRLLSAQLALCAALALLPQTTFAQTCQTVDDFQYVAGQGDQARLGKKARSLYAAAWGDAHDAAA